MYWSLKSKAFQAACVVHGVFFALLIISALLTHFKPEEKRHVFTLVMPPSSAPKSQPREAFPSIKSPEVAQAKVSKHEIPTPPPAKKEPIPVKQPTVPTGKKLVSYDDFVKKHGAPKTTKPQETAKPVSVPRINSKGFSTQLQQVLVHNSSTGTWASSDNNALSDYLAQLKVKLDAVWVKPQSLSKLSHLETMVEFTIESNGLLSAVHVVGPSGQRLFDDSVTQAFAKLHVAGIPPDSKRYSLRLTFKMEG